jgi:PEP-CTERM/exosortase A-associated glycosyltransferase
MHSGYAFRTYQIIMQQQSLGWETVQITSGKQDNSSEQIEFVEGLKFYRTNMINTYIYRLSILKQIKIVIDLFFNILKTTKLEDPDILHAHSPVFNGIAGLLVSKITKKPLVYEIRGFWEDAAVDTKSTTEKSIRYKMTRLMETLICNHADKVTTICNSLKNELIERNIANEKITVIPNGVNIDQFQIIEDRNADLVKKFGLHNQLVVGFIGSFYPYEGIDLLLEAVKVLSDKGLSIRCIIVGGGPEEEALRGLSRKLDIVSLVTFTGRVPHNKVPEYYSVIDLLVYARKSKRITELVTPLKPLEAMSQKRPFLASNVGGHKELIIDGETGLLFEKDSLEDLVNKILHFSESRFEIDQILENGYNYVKTKKNWSHSTAGYKKVYAGLDVNMSYV